ncbi:uncharacterized protein LOC141910342 [Tubulanus polymorphus]|uniref:uncharacterized protein LOC141910342 n=1 Tax=Tubulanus polymorphus TaxID=672921 RepID=UPI003DA4262F
MASQPKIVELFPVKKKPGNLQASKRRKVHLLPTAAQQQQQQQQESADVTPEPPKRSLRSASAKNVVAPVAKPASKSRNSVKNQTKLSSNKTQKTLEEILYHSERRRSQQ